MLNDYEISTIEKNQELHPVLSSLRLVAFAVAIVCSIILVPDAMEKINETRADLVDDSLKIRVVANSNTDADQQLKKEMVQNLTPFFTAIQQNESANLANDDVYAELSNYVDKYYRNENVKIHIGDNLMPPKLQAAMFYPQSTYQSLVLTIGEGRGDNWWCSIFQNVCEASAKKDQDEEKAKDEEKEEPKVTFIVWEWFKKWLG
ncbi:stage II sporulation protein R [Lysinibacillus yapensis]|nr:stage II sporulation protein R [Lysinibacillus yapensis]